MHRRSFLREALLLLFVLCSLGAHALNFRSYLSVNGSDANPCTVQAPCRLLPAALAAVSDGGEVWILDSANFNAGAVTIGKSVSILAAPGAVGSFVASSGGPALQISAAGLHVTLRNVVVIPLAGNPGSDGVLVTGASALTIDHGVLANFTGNAVYMQDAGKLEITRSILRDNAGAAVVLTAGAATISNTDMLNNYQGVVVYAGNGITTKTVITDCVISGEGASGWGVYAYTDATTGSVTQTYITRSTIEGALFALNASSNAGTTSLITIGSSMVTNNTYGWVINGSGGTSTVKSLGNNDFQDNGGTIGPLTVASPQ